MSDNPMLVGGMANTSNLQLSPEAEDRLKRLQSAEGKSFTEMVELLGLRPSSSFRGADLRGVDLRGARLAGYDFTGADLAGALMDGADFEGAVVDEHWLATSSEVAATVVPSPTVPVLGVDVQPGNYIIIVGRPGSGKSSFASHLVRYFMTKGGWFATPDANQVLQYRHIMFDWQEQWDRGRFPEATNQRHSPQLRFNVAPTSRNLPTVPVCLLEFSVESFLQLFCVDDKKPELLSVVSPFLNRDNVNVTFVFLSNVANPIKDEDFLFSRLLDSISSNVKRPFKNQYSAVLVVADPDMMTKHFARPLRESDGSNSRDLNGFADRYFPAALARLGGWQNRAVIAPFSVGKIATGRDVETGKFFDFIEEPSFEDVEMIWEWIYHRWTGYDLRPRDSLAMRASHVLQWLRKIGSQG